MDGVLAVVAGLLRGHASAVVRQAKALALWIAVLIVCGLVAGIYLVILLTHLLALWLGTATALAAVAGVALVGCLIAALMLRTAKRRLVEAHTRHVAQERRVAQRLVAELAAAWKLSGALAALSTGIAALILLVLRRLGGQEGAPEPAAPPGDVSRAP